MLWIFQKCKLTVTFLTLMGTYDISRKPCEAVKCSCYSITANLKGLLICGHSIALLASLTTSHIQFAGARRTVWSEVELS